MSLGALYTAIDPELGQRDFARASFGTAYNVPYNPEIHIGLPVFDTPKAFDHRKEVEGAVSWGVFVGTNLRELDQEMFVSGHITIFRTDVFGNVIDPAMKIYTTTDETVGLQQGVK